jgi:hypothetical protein
MRLNNSTQGRWYHWMVMINIFTEGASWGRLKSCLWTIVKTSATTKMCAERGCTSSFLLWLGSFLMSWAVMLGRSLMLFRWKKKWRSWSLVPESHRSWITLVTCELWKSFLLPSGGGWAASRLFSWLSLCIFILNLLHGIFKKICSQYRYIIRERRLHNLFLFLCLHESLILLMHPKLLNKSDVLNAC